MRLFKIYDAIETAVALCALAGVVLAVLIAAVGRSLGWPVASAPQFAQLFLIWACMLGADIALRQGEHIRVSALSDMLSPKARAALSLFGIALILPFLAFIAWHGWHLALGNWERELGASGLSYGLVTLALPVCAVLIAMSIIRRLFETKLAQFFEPDGLADTTHRADAQHSAEDLL
ncbi:TRAP transporter small permease [Oceaniovalibus sp. ACAM 378]|uniref:TRAP transporter small permease n=1 Tax=Oceaniovalibus sp. ACAM 378 TaxID=2599923 RepID=UPI0011DB9AF8|nr:TRAP transporter small permease [Oceaniovalibus sp. ACAM 378]TYB84522.1 TRAP transporter small permease [Oceaniovalibus sp. ACAM 378]